MAEDMNFVIPVTQKCSEVLESSNLPVHKTYLCFPKYWPIQSEFPGEQSVAFISSWLHITYYKINVEIKKVSVDGPDVARIENHW